MKSTSRAVMKYEKENITRIIIKINKKTEKELLDFMSGVENKQGFIKKLIMDYINENKK